MKRKKHLALILACVMASQLIGCNTDEKDIKSPNNENAIVESSDKVVDETATPIVSMDSTPAPTVKVEEESTATQGNVEAYPTNQEDEQMDTNNPSVTNVPTEVPQGTLEPTVKPEVTGKPTKAPTAEPTAKPTAKPTATAKATVKPTVAPTVKPIAKPTVAPTAAPTAKPIPEITIYSENVPFSWYWDEVKDEYVELLEERIVYYLNLYRAEEGTAPATRLPGLSEYAALRAWQSENRICGSTKDGHVCEPEVCGSQGHNYQCGLIAAEMLQYGRYVVPSEAAQALGATPYWSAEDGEAYMATSLFTGYSIDEIARGRVSVFRKSEGHWRYLGDDFYRYVGVGISDNGHDLIISVSQFDDNHISYHHVHNPAYTYPDDPNYETCFDECHCDEYN